MFYTQVDKKWKDEIMTHPKGQVDPDTIGSVGCYLTAICNILKYRGEYLTPNVLNDIIVRNKGYLYLYDNQTPINKASYLRIQVLEKLYGFQKTNYRKNKYLLYGVDLFYIGKIKVTYNSKTYTHFVNIIRDYADYKLCFDVYSGKKIKVLNDNFVDIYKLEF
jgi:hypothetical protein